MIERKVKQPLAIAMEQLNSFLPVGANVQGFIGKLRGRVRFFPDWKSIRQGKNREANLKELEKNIRNVGGAKLVLRVRNYDLEMLKRIMEILKDDEFRKTDEKKMKKFLECLSIFQKTCRKRGTRLSPDTIII
jgi:hypothetical protein